MGVLLGLLLGRGVLWVGMCVMSSAGVSDAESEPHRAGVLVPG